MSFAASNNEPPEEKENAEKPPVERLKNDYQLEFNAGTVFSFMYAYK